MREKLTSSLHEGEAGGTFCPLWATPQPGGSCSGFAGYGQHLFPSFLLHLDHLNRKKVERGGKKIKTNHEGPRIKKNIHGRTTKGQRSNHGAACTRHVLHTKGIPPGARASRPHNDGFLERGRPARTMMAPRERGRPARTKPGTASAISPTWINRHTWVAFGLANAVPTNRMDACKLALTLSGLYEGKRMRAETPRAPGGSLPLMRRGGGTRVGAGESIFF